MPVPEKGYACNCSICSRSGWLLNFVEESAVQLLSGEDVLQDYRFGKMALNHQFCRNCGVRAFSRGKNPNGQPTFAINLRTLEDFDVSKLEVVTFDGKSI
jgi:hypothetical protein